MDACCLFYFSISDGIVHNVAWESWFPIERLLATSYLKTLFMSPDFGFLKDMLEV
eukprot:m.250995 g.250995  ORF g.250995 m.250995 type:complete len:55 (+) comp17181_c9_seq2:1315-1479(+)